jgi:hypothetical protein
LFNEDEWMRIQDTRDFVSALPSIVIAVKARPGLAAKQHCAGLGGCYLFTHAR